MDQSWIKLMESEKRHFIGCALLALGLMIFMWVGSFMDYGHDNRASMHLIGILSGLFMCIFTLLVRSIGKSINLAKQERMARPVQDWYNG